MSLVIQPFDLTQVKIDDLLLNGTILPANGLKTWHASIFPLSKKDQINTPTWSKDNILTFIDDSFWTNRGLNILDSQNSLVEYENGNKWIKSQQFGDWNNSIKRYTSLDNPIDYVKEDASAFLNIHKPLPKSLDVANPNLFFKSETTISPIERISAEDKLFGTNINNPHIQLPKISGHFKHNNKQLIESIFNWTLDQGIKYVYCINEWRPYVISKNYVTGAVYYTVKGSK